MEQQPGLSERKDRCRPVTGFLGAAWCGGSPARKVAHQQRLDCKLNSKGVNTSYNVQKRVIPIRQSADNLFISQRLCVIQNEEVPLLSTGSPSRAGPVLLPSLHFTSACFAHCPHYAWLPQLVRGCRPRTPAFRAHSMLNKAVTVQTQLLVLFVTWCDATHVPRLS